MSIIRKLLPFLNVQTAAVAALIASLAFLYAYFVGPVNKTLYHYDSKNGWIYAGNSFGYFEINDIRVTEISAESLIKSPIVGKNTVLVVKGEIRLRKRPFGAIPPRFFDWIADIGLSESPIISSVGNGKKLKVNEVLQTGWHSIWYHVTVVGEEHN